MQPTRIKLRRNKNAGILEIVLWLGIATLTVIIPNSFKEVTISLLVATTTYYLLWKRILISKSILVMWFATACVSLVYILVGLVNDAPIEAGIQVVVIYILAPFLWIVSISGALSSFKISVIVKFLLILTILAMASQVLYYWAFVSGRFATLLIYMAGNPNLDYSNNQVAAVMFVFGSMNFLFAGFLSSPEVVGNRLTRLFLISAIFVSAITTGRSIVVLSVAVGVLIGIIASVRLSADISRSLFFSIFAFCVGTIFGQSVLSSLYDIDIYLPIQVLIDKIISGGGEGRQDYIPQLLVGAADHYFLGAGHGIGVDYAASEKFPWRYEVVGVATLFRVGLVGTIVYCLPLVAAIWIGIRKAKNAGLSREEKYLLGALVAAVMSTNTNPFIEAVVFQWMYILPCTYFLDRSKQS